MSTEDAEAAAAVCGVAGDNHDDGDAIEKAELGVKRPVGGGISLFLGGGHGSIIHYLGEVGSRIVRTCCCACGYTVP